MMMGGPRHGGLLGQEARKPRDPKQTLRRLLRYFSPYGVILTAVGLLIVLGTIMTVASPFLLGQAIDCFVAPSQNSACALSDSPRPDLSGLLVVVGVMALMAVVDAAAGGGQFYLMSLAGQRVVRQLRAEAFDKLHALSVRFFTEHETGDVMSRLTNDLDTLTQAVNFGLVRMLGSVLSIIGIMAAMLGLSTALALFSLTVAPVMILVTVILSDLARRAYRETRVQMGSVNADLQQAIVGVREAQAFSREDENIGQFRRVNEANRNANVRAVAITSTLMPSLNVLSTVATAIVAGVGGIIVVRGQPVLGQIVTVGVIVAFLNYVARFYQPVQQIAQLWTTLQSAVAGAERIFELLDEPLDVADAPGAAELPPVRGLVEFRGVAFRYTDAVTVAGEGGDVITGVDLVAEPGTVTAFVGPTGAGKTTLVNLIPRFYDVTAGAVLVDGHDVRSVSQESLRRQIGVVLQDTFLFSATVRENIRYGRPEASDAEVEEAARISLASEFIQRLPDGYETVLGERGNNLSQGQRQLIAIARAALADPRILILDEATSSVDTRTERLIQKALGDLMRGRTSFVVAHRLSTIRGADQVLVVADHGIVERGTHQSLLALRGRYYEMYTSNTLARREEIPA